jgi:pantoate ligase/cytidylate kinase
MRILRTAAELNLWQREVEGHPLHFVPTMGALHAGHGELLRRAAVPAPGGRPPRLVMSIFVNPLQFGPDEDFDRYPRDAEADAAMAERHGVEALFLPSAGVLFPHGPENLTRVLPPAPLTGVLCGPCRPGHFEGVATVVARLLALIRPCCLFLGEKDWQQLVILRRVVADLGLPVEIRSCGTVRRPDGQAWSSRLVYLHGDQSRQAAALPRALASMVDLHRRGERGRGPLLEALRGLLEDGGLTVEYVDLVRAHDLQPLERVEGITLLAAAVRCGATRLIDHAFLMNRSPIVAIDGPAGAGKSTVTRALARRLGLLYLDTGAMYRGVTWWVQRHGADPADPAAVAPLLEGLELRLEGADGGEQRVWVNGHDVSAAIRGAEVTAAVSLVASHACVREALTLQQREMGRRGGLVAEGRDIGTAVFPDAECKVFLTASVAERARRRALDLHQRGLPVPPLAELEHQIAERDQRDSSRAVAPLRRADDAEELVTDGMDIETVLEALVVLFRRRVPEDAWPVSPPA